jgi:hypothetical protein
MTTNESAIRLAISELVSVNGAQRPTTINITNARLYCDVSY